MILDETNHRNFLDNIKNGLIREKLVKRSGYIISLTVNLILLYIVNNLLSWNLPFISVTFSQVLWVINLSIVVSIIRNIVFIKYNPLWFRHIMNSLIYFFGLIAVYILYKVFPLIYSQNYMVLYYRILFILIIVGLVISIFFEILKFRRIIVVNMKMDI
jgi:hypothetical protein